MLEKQADLVTAKGKKKRIRERPTTEVDKKSEDNEHKLYSFPYGWPYLLSTQCSKTNYGDVTIS